MSDHEFRHLDGQGDVITYWQRWKGVRSVRTTDTHVLACEKRQAKEVKS